MNKIILALILIFGVNVLAHAEDNTKRVARNRTYTDYYDPNESQFEAGVGADVKVYNFSERAGLEIQGRKDLIEPTRGSVYIVYKLDLTK